jgi:hypothetical protein
MVVACKLRREELNTLNIEMDCNKWEKRMNVLGWRWKGCWCWLGRWVVEIST